MNQSHLLPALALTLTGALVSGCMTDDPALASDEQGVWNVMVGNFFAPAGSFSGSARNNSTDLTATIDCLAAHPHSDHKAFFITGLKAFRERAGNADNFVARLDVTCAEYGGDPVDHQFDQTGAPSFDSTLYSGGIRNTSGQTAVPASNIPIGIRITKNPSDAYVKDVEMLFGFQQGSGGAGFFDGYSFPHGAGPALGLSGTTQNLVCDDQTVLNHLVLTFDPANGKIRSMRLECSEVLDF